MALAAPTHFPYDSFALKHLLSIFLMLAISLLGMLAARGEERIVFRESLRVTLIESCVIEESAQPSKVTLFYWQEWNMLAEASYATSWSGSTLQGAVFELGTKFYWGIDLSGSPSGAGGVGGLIGMARKVGTAAAQAAIFPAYDATGNLVALLDAAGNNVAAYEYDPFGKTIRATGAKARENPFRFASKYLDAETGLIYHNARYYSTELGRFISQDPIGESGGMNLYAYAGNNPAGNVDYLGYAMILNGYNTTVTNSISSYTSFDHAAYNRDMRSFTNTVNSLYDSAYDRFRTRQLGNSVSLRNDASNFEAWATSIWNVNVIKKTSFNNDYWEPYYNQRISQAFMGTPLGTVASGYGLFHNALQGLRDLRRSAEASPYDPQGFGARSWEIFTAITSSLEYAAREVTGIKIPAASRRILILLHHPKRRKRRGI
jgi:RHS repeat-associated protein